MAVSQMVSNSVQLGATILKVSSRMISSSKGSGSEGFIASALFHPGLATGLAALHGSRFASVCSAFVTAS